MAMPLAEATWFHKLGIGQATFMADPYPIYEEWRKNGALWQTGDHQWMTIRYEDVKRVLTEPAFQKPPVGMEQPLAGFEHLPPLAPSMLMSNPPNHTRLRRLVSEAFQPRHLSRLRPFITALAEHLAGQLRKAGGGNLVTDFSFPIPALVIAELLGVPRDDQGKFRSWSQDVARLLDPSQSLEVRQQAFQSRWELLDYFHHLIQAKRQAPANDLLTELIAVEADGDRLSAGELLSMALLLLVAGHETTTNLLSMGVLVLIQNPGALPSNPDWELVVEELLRYTSPVQFDGRVTQAPLELSGQKIAEGSRILLGLGAANRDPNIFPHAHQLDLTRQPNPHLAFGRGIHFCLGAALARLEATIALPFLWQGRGLTLKGDPVWNPNIILRGLASLSVEVV